MSTKLENRPLCAIRGLAASWVVLYHLNGLAPPVLAGRLVADGWAGVDIFFVLSGYILTSVYGARARADLVGFYLRRLCRIYPLHFVIMLGLSTSVLCAPLLGLRLTDTRFHEWSNFPIVLLLLQPYLPQWGQWWNAPSWSAAVELSCYAAFPFVVPVLDRLTRAWRLLAMAGLIAVQIWLQHDASEGAYIGWPSLLRGASGFGLGTLLHGLLASWRPGLVTASLAEAAALAGILGGCALGAPYLVQPLGALLVGALSRDCGAIAYVLRCSPLVWLGRVSFSIYLLHDPLMVLLLKLLPAGGAAEALLTPPVHRLLLILAVVAAAWVTYRMVEVPGKRSVLTIEALRNAARVAA